MSGIVGIEFAVDEMSAVPLVYTLTVSIDVMFRDSDTEELMGEIEICGEDPGLGDDDLFAFFWFDLRSRRLRRTFRFVPSQGREQRKAFTTGVRARLLDEDPGAGFVDIAPSSAPQPAFRVRHHLDEVYARATYTADGVGGQVRRSAAVTGQFGPGWQIAGEDEGNPRP